MKCVMGLGRGLLRSVSIALVLTLIFPLIGTGIAQADPGWYHCSWQYRKKITIDNTKVTVNLSHFPVLINLTSDSDLTADAQNDGDDILFTSSDGTAKLSHEIEKFDGTTGELVAWVRVPSLSSSADTDLYMYYGNAAAANQEDITGTWDSNFVGVWHLPEDPSGTAPQILDSTANDNDGTTEGSWGSSNQVSGLIDGSLDFNSGIDKVKVGTFDVVAGGSGNDGITLEAWVYADVHKDARFISKATGTNDNDHWWMLNAIPSGSNSFLRFRLKTGGTTTALLASSPHVFPVGQWVHTVATYDGSTMRIYQDTTQVVSTAKSGTINTDNSVKVAIGNQPPGAGDRRFDGRMTEVRVSNIARSADWIQTEFNNQKYPDKAIHGAAGFFALGSEETVPSTPIVTTNSATLVEENTATLNGTLTNDGGAACQYQFQYGTTLGGPYPNSTGWTGSITTGQSFNANLTGLSEGTRYYFIAQAKNGCVTSSGSEQTFLTKPDPPYNFTATAASSTQIDLSWTKGDGAQKTHIVRKTGGYPANRTDGTQIYFDTGTSFSDTGLSPSTTYYYSAWSEVTGSQQWSDNYAQASATTSGGIPPPPPTSVGGDIYPVNKISVLAPWIGLMLLLPLAMSGGFRRLRQRRIQVNNREL